MNVSRARYCTLWLVSQTSVINWGRESFFQVSHAERMTPDPNYVQEKNRYIARTAPSMNAIARRPM